MPIPRLLLKNVIIELTSYCDNRIPKEIRDKLTLGFIVEGNSIILFERRPHYMNKNKMVNSPIAKIRYLPVTREWQLYYMNRNLTWCKYWNYEPKKRFSTILKEIDRDPTCIFWG